MPYTVSGALNSKNPGLGHNGITCLKNYNSVKRLTSGLIKKSSIKKAVNERYLEFLVQRFDIILHTLYQLCLVFSDGTADVRPNEQSIEPRKDAEHFVGVTCCAKLVSQTGRDAGLHAINALIVSTHKLGIV